MNFRTGRRGTLEGVRYSDPLERVTKREPPPVAPWDDEMFREQRDRDLAEQPIGWRRAVGAVFVALLVAGETRGLWSGLRPQLLHARGSRGR